MDSQIEIDEKTVFSNLDKTADALSGTAFSFLTIKPITINKPKTPI